MLALVRIVMVEIPIEVRFPFFLQAYEQLSFYFLQEVEAHEKVVVVFERQFLVLHHFPVERPFVCYVLFFQDVIEVVVNFFKMAP